jgi:hypothetical protein
MADVPNWSGPAVHAKHLGDRGLEIELVAPTAGHAFELRDVQLAAGRTDLHFVHRTPENTFVAQVVTPLRVTVPPERLGEARAVFVWVASEPPRRPEELAIAVARP